MRRLIYSALGTISLAICAGTPRALASVNIVVQPTNQIALVTSNATFAASVATTAGETITGFTWLMSSNGLSPFVAVPGATTATCTINNVQTTHAGFYFVRVNYASGTSQLTTASGSVELVVRDGAHITVQPLGLIRATGNSASIAVTALGDLPISYQWRVNGTNLTDDARVNGATTSSLAIPDLALSDGGIYDVVVSNLYASVVSHPAPLTVVLPPQNAAVILGSNAVFNVSTSGSAPLTYGWQKGGSSLADGGRINGAASDTLTIADTLVGDTGNYRIVISDGVTSFASATASLTVLIPPRFTSATNALGQQGHPFIHSTRATGTLPITFGADALPTGLTMEPTNGVISGIPAVFGDFDVTLYATNAALTITQLLTLTLITDVPGITSPLIANGRQGQFFTYAVTASNDPVTFSASELPLGLSFDPVTATIFGPPVVSGSFPITITASNQYGGDTQTLILNLASAVPVVTSPLTASGTENATGFSYTITASNSPTAFAASGLPLGLSVNSSNGVISGTPLYGGTFNVVISALNAWGTGSNVLALNLNYAAISNLTIAGANRVYSKPYVLDFQFTLRDDPTPGSGNPVVRPISQLQVVCMEDGVPIPGETIFIADRGNRKQMKTFMALDYTFSMFAVTGAIAQMQNAAETFINLLPTTAQFGIYEFHADYVDPLLVTTNGFTSDKALLGKVIDGIQTNYVQGNYAGTRAFDTLHNAISKFGPFNATNRDEQRYVVVMTDGNDDSSLLNTNADPIDVLITLAQANQVRVFCVAFGPDINTNVLQRLTSQTFGRYYEAATTADLPDQFLKIVKDIDGQYLLRWASLKRASKLYQPSFQVTVDGFTDTYNTNVLYTTNMMVDTNTMPATTNITVTNTTADYFPPTWAGDVKAGSLRLVADADQGPQTIRLRATYAPRYVREIRLSYRPNYPCTASLDSAGPGGILSGWSLTETNDGTNGFLLTLASPDPTDLLTSIPYGAFGDLVTFHFLYPNLVTGTQAFSSFKVDNSIYTNIVPTGQSFVFENVTNFVTLYPQPPPHGTPIPWLIAYGFTNNFDVAESSDPNTNGLPVWQEYIAGLNPRDPNSKFSVGIINAPPAAPAQIIFSTVPDRTYRLESAFSLDTWTVLRDNIAGTGGNLMFTDLRNLSGVHAVFYRVAVY